MLLPVPAKPHASHQSSAAGVLVSRAPLDYQMHTGVHVLTQYTDQAIVEMLLEAML